MKVAKLIWIPARISLIQAVHYGYGVTVNGISNEAYLAKEKGKVIPG